MATAPPPAGPQRLLRGDGAFLAPAPGGAAAAAGRAALAPGVRGVAAAVPAPRAPGLPRRRHWRVLSFPALLSRARALARALLRRGLGRGDVAFVLAPAGLDVPVLYLALLTLGAVVCPANPALTAAEVTHLAALSGASVAFAVSPTAAKLPPGLPAVLLDSDDFRASLQSNDDGEDTASIVVRQSDTAAIQFSSGTTGRVKAAALPHRGFIAMAAGARALFGRPRLGRERTLLTAPMFHSMGFAVVLRGVVREQTTVVVTGAVARDGVKGVLAAAERWAVTEITAAPPVVMATVAKDATCSLRALERVMCGGAPLPVSAAERFRRRFPGVDLCMGYGSTEGGGISRMMSREECARMGSAGRISENVEVKIIDTATGKPLGVCQNGELLVRGPAVMSGYVGDDEANAATFDSEGWLKTGDLCYIDQDGFLFVVDRLKELIKYKGYQSSEQRLIISCSAAGVPPAELELVLQSLPEVVDAAVMPYPHEEAGQIPIALVVRQPGSKVTEEQVMDHVAKRVAPYKRIRKVLFVDSIPKSPAGKILRRQLTNYVHGYSAATGTFRSLRPPVPLPPPEAPLSLPAFVASLLPSPPPAHPAFLDAATGASLSYPAFLSRARALAGALRRRGLARGAVAFVLAPAGLDVPVLYFALLTLGAVVCPANPALTPAEVAHLAALSGASVAFAVSRTAAKLPPGLPAVLLDSDDFRASLQSNGGGDDNASIVAVRQSDTAAIQFSSGTTGRVKAAALPHRGFIAMAAGARALFGRPRPGRERTLLTAPLFHSMGFAFVMRGVALGQTTVVATDAVARAGVKGVVAAAERWAVAEMTAAPPLVVAFAKDATCRLPALERIICGGAPLPVSAAERFRRRFPDVDLCMQRVEGPESQADHGTNFGN
ncbi:hypothetical protein U9M48_004572 [Paspalum notatum var. saurae]|uniref:4-coumarate--CoA ligase n=1 Tax=Paspalum notatum var. saurae TaxID=547442 RepID=A0AAQ3PQB5_PASNO